MFSHGGKILGHAILSIMIVACVMGFVIIVVSMMIFRSRSDPNDAVKSGKKESISSKKWKSIATSVEISYKEKHLCSSRDTLMVSTWRTYSQTPLRCSGRGYMGWQIRRPWWTRRRWWFWRGWKRWRWLGWSSSSRWTWLGGFIMRMSLHWGRIIVWSTKKVLVYDYFSKGRVSTLSHGFDEVGSVSNTILTCFHNCMSYLMWYLCSIYR